MYVHYLYFFRLYIVTCTCFEFKCCQIPFPFSSALEVSSVVACRCRSHLSLWNGDRWAALPTLWCETASTFGASRRLHPKAQAINPDARARKALKAVFDKNLGLRVGERVPSERRDGIECFSHVVPCRGVVHDAEPEGQRPPGN